MLTQVGYPYKLIANVPLTSNDFIGIDLLIDTTISMDDTCSNNFENSLPTIQNYLDSGGSAFWLFCHTCITNCNQYKLVNLVNPYINLPDVTSENTPWADVDGFITQNLPSYKSTILTTPNDIFGREIIVDAPIAPFEGVDAGSILVETFASELSLAAVYAGDDVVVCGGRYVIWGDFLSFLFQNLDIFENIIEFLLLDVVDECICDVENECNGFECGIGCNGGECPNTCPSDVICYENKCGCTDGFVEFAGDCIDCPATFENCIDCTLTACTYCSNNYHLENGECVLDTVFGYDNLSQYNFEEESSYSDSPDSSEPSIIPMIDFFASPDSNNFKGIDNDLSIENSCDILSICLWLSVTIIIFTM